MMKREQILCDRCCREFEARKDNENVAVEVTFQGNPLWLYAFEHLCDTCKRTLGGALNKYKDGYATTRAKLLGGDAVEPEA